MSTKLNDCICGFSSGGNAGNCERCKLVARIRELEKQLTEMPQPTHALIVLLHDRLGFTNHAVLLFTSEESAVHFAVQRLIEHGEIMSDETGLWSQCRQEHFGDEAEALEAFHDSLYPTEYFHVKQVG